MDSLDEAVIRNLKAFERALLHGTAIYKKRKPSPAAAVWYLKTYPTKPSQEVLLEIAFRYHDSDEVQKALEAWDQSSEVRPRQVRGNYVVLSIWADGIDDPTWLCSHLDYPEWIHTVNASELLATPVDGQVPEDDRLRLCHLFFDKI